MPWLNEALGKGLVRGGTYLTVGAPGIGKSTLMIQALADLALQGEDVLYLSTEQGIDSVERALERTCSNRAGRLPQAIRDHFYMDDRLKDIAYLSSFLEEEILDKVRQVPGGPRHRPRLDPRPGPGLDGGEVSLPTSSPSGRS